jgi:hypothetical protein
VRLKRDYYLRCMDSMATNGIVLPTNPMTAMAMGFEDQSREMSSTGMAGRYMSVDNGGNAASNMIRMKLLIFSAKAKRPAENSPAVVAYSIRTSFS